MIVRMRTFAWMPALLLAAVLLSGCGSSRPYTIGPVKTEDPDRRPVPKPREIEQNFYWDRVDLTVFHQAKKPLNLAWTGRKIGAAVGIGDGGTPAENVNVFDEPPRSSWWTPRDYYQPMTPEALAVGANTDARPDAGPDPNGTWTIWRGKSVGAASGFFIEDARGVRYLLKFDKPAYPELASSAEVISTKILHAAGYHVPENTIAYVHPDQIEIGEGASVQDGNARRPMRTEDVASVLEGQPRRDDGRVRVMASRFVDGEVLGPWNFRGRRDDDPNDRIRHQNRRELRGLRVISAWLNDTDRRAANTLAVYTDEKYVRHVVQDMSSTLGANTGAPHLPIHGQAYMIDHRKMASALVGLGLYRFPWWYYDGSAAYPSVGYWRSDVFRPGDWVPTYPNPAFEKMTPRDAFWGAKLVMAFSDKDLRAIVETAEMSNPDAEAYLLDVLKKRRDKTGRYWFRQMAPLDRFRVERAPQAASSVRAEARHESEIRPGEAHDTQSADLVLAFDDLARRSGLWTDGAYRYTLTHDGETISSGVQTSAGDRVAVPLSVAGRSVRTWLTEAGADRPHARVVRVTLQPVYSVRQADGSDAQLQPSPVEVYVAIPTEPNAPPEVSSVFDRSTPAPSAPRVVGLRRSS